MAYHRTKGATAGKKVLVGTGNAQELDTKGPLAFLKSYEAIVAVTDGTGKALRTAEFHSRTTSKHINAWLVEVGASDVQEISQERLDEIWEHSRNE